MSVKNLTNEQINALRKDPSNYEAHRKVAAKVNEIISSRKGTALQQKDLVLSSGFGTGSLPILSGSAKRGTISVTVGPTGLGLNPTLTLNFPAGEFDEMPFALVQRSDGTGLLDFSYTIDQRQLIIMLGGTPAAGETYVFMYMVSD